MWSEYGLFGLLRSEFIKGAIEWDVIVFDLVTQLSWRVGNEGAAVNFVINFVNVDVSNISERYSCFIDVGFVHGSLKRIK